ncbi:MAG: hypothetical protein IJV88_02915 [Ruminococcus sp.]|nr:hypothetical protein [Ruminococcus sp.]
MKTIKLFSISLVVILLMTAVGVFSVLAVPEENVQTPSQAPVTDPVVTNPMQTDPVVITTATQPAYTDQPSTQVTVPMTSVPVTDPVEQPTTVYTPPVEYDELNPPATQSYYEGNAHMNDVELEEKVEETFVPLDVDEIVGMSVENNDKDGIKSFKEIKQNTSAEDEVSPFFLILGLVLIFVALGGITFAILFKGPKKASAHMAAAKAGSHSAGRSRDDYNDPFDDEYEYDDRSAKDYDDGF